MEMLTRTQVARRLGRSIATVRRLEGEGLHPVTDERGVHWFDEREVDRLLFANRGHGRRSATASEWLSKQAGDESPGEEEAQQPIDAATALEARAARVAEQEAEVARREADVTCVLEKHARLESAERERERRERDELSTAAIELLIELDSCPAHIAAEVVDDEMLADLAMALDLDGY
jgi:hypothetical protein